jgi:hypothetical protein
LTNLDGPGYLTGGSIQQTMATPAVTKNGEFVALYPSFVASQNVFPAYYLAKSVDQGQTLTYSTVYTATAGTSNTNFKKGYLLITDPSDSDKMVFLSPASPNNESDIEATHSNDGGQTWSARIRVNDDAIGNGKAQDMVWGAYNETGKLVVTWRDRRNSSVNDFWGAGYDFYYATSSDNGQTFGQNQKLTSQFVAFDSLITNSGNDFMSCTYSGDTLYSVWGDTRNNKMNIYFAKTLVSLNTTIGVSHLNMDETNWSIFPNPVEDYINLSVDKSLIGDQIGIYNFDGKFIKQTEIQSTENQIDLNDLASGNYLIVVGESVKKFIKK